MSGVTNEDLDALLTRLEQRRRDQPDASPDQVLGWLLAGIDAIKARAALLEARSDTSDGTPT